MHTLECGHEASTRARELCKTWCSNTGQHLMPEWTFSTMIVDDAIILRNERQERLNLQIQSLDEEKASSVIQQNVTLFIGLICDLWRNQCRSRVSCLQYRSKDTESDPPLHSLHISSSRSVSPTSTNLQTSLVSSNDKNEENPESFSFWKWI